jgi:hypothetical protein
MSDRVYRGRWLPGGQAEVTADGRPLVHVVVHSPTGFAWGYGGSGPADLALSILADFLGERPSGPEMYEGRSECSRHYQGFKWAFIAPLDQDSGWVIHGSQIAAWLRTNGRRQAAGS